MTKGLYSSGSTGKLSSSRILLSAQRNHAGGWELENAVQDRWVSLSNPNVRSARKLLPKHVKSKCSLVGCYNLRIIEIEADRQLITMFCSSYKECIVPYCERELTRDYQALFLLFSDMSRSDCEGLTRSEKLAKANSMLKQCSTPSALGVLENDHIQLLNNLMFVEWDDDNQLAAGVDRLSRLANNIGIVLLATDYFNGKLDPPEEIGMAIDEIRRFQAKISAYIMPFQAMIDSDLKIQSVIEKAEKDLHDVTTQMDVNANRVLEDMTSSLEAIKDKATVDHIGVLGVFSAVAFVFSGGIGIIGDSFELIPVQNNPALGFLLIAFMGLLFVNAIALLLWFVAVIVGKQDVIKHEGLCLLMGIDAMLLVVVLGVAASCYLGR